MAPSLHHSIPTNLETLLEGPAPSQCTSQVLDLAKCGLPHYADCFVMQVYNVLTPEECSQLLKAAEATTNGKWEQALINVGGGEQALNLDARNCSRIIWDDKILAQRLLNRIMPHLPSDIVTLQNRPGVNGPGPTKRKEIWEISRLNERLRFLRYTPDMYFKPHYDGCYVTPDGKETSFLTVHLYLNDVDRKSVGRIATGDSNDGNEGSAETKATLQGGSTRFFSNYTDEVFDVLPETGMCLVFQHRKLIHSGEDVVQGVKYTVRTDVMYQKVEKRSSC